MIKKKHQQGFSLLEMVMALAILSAVLSVVFIGTSNFVDRSEVQENEYNLNKLSTIFRDHYDLFAYDVETHSSGYNVDGKSIAIARESLTTDIKDSLSNMSSSLSVANFDFTDGYNQPYLVLVSNRIEKEYQGIEIPYRVIAIVSNRDGDFANGEPEFDTTMNFFTGEVTADDDETVAVIDTYNSQVKKFIETKRKIEKIGEAYTQLYWSRFNQDTTGGDREKDYFANGPNSNWDSNSQVDQACTSATSISGRSSPGLYISDTGLDEELLFSRSSYLDGWGNEMYVLNCGSVSNVEIGGDVLTLSPRNPDSGDSQPYNAIIGATLSNGQSYIKTITARM